MQELDRILDRDDLARFCWVRNPIMAASVDDLPERSSRSAGRGRRSPLLRAIPTITRGSQAARIGDLSAMLRSTAREGAALALQRLTRKRPTPATEYEQ